MNLEIKSHLSPLVAFKKPLTMQTMQCQIEVVHFSYTISGFNLESVDHL